MAHLSTEDNKSVVENIGRTDPKATQSIPEPLESDTQTFQGIIRNQAYNDLVNDISILREKRNKSVDTDENVSKFSFNSNVKFTHFNRFRFTDELDYMTSGIGYVFMTKPHLNLFNNKDIQDNFLYSIANGTTSLSKMIVENLDAFAPTDIKTKFMPIITSSAENFETKDNILKTRETGENFIGNKIIYGDVQTESLNADTFSIQYKEYNDASLLLLHKTWVDYIHAVKINKIRPRRYSYVNNLTVVDAIPSHGDAYTDQETGTDYVINRILDYASSVYYFLLDPDGTTIRYWCKYTGVFPTSVPYGAMSFKLGENTLKDLNIIYQYTFKNDLDPYTLEEFAYLTSSNQAVHVQGINATNLDKQHDPLTNNTWRKFVTISNDRKRLIFTDLI